MHCHILECWQQQLSNFQSVTFVVFDVFWISYICPAFSSTSSLPASTRPMDFCCDVVKKHNAQLGDLFLFPCTKPVHEPLSPYAIPVRTFRHVYIHIKESKSRVVVVCVMQRSCTKGMSNKSKATRSRGDSGRALWALVCRDPKLLPFVTCPKRHLEPSIHIGKAAVPAKILLSTPRLETTVTNGKQK